MSTPQEWGPHLWSVGEMCGLCSQVSGSATLPDPVTSGRSDPRWGHSCPISTVGTLAGPPHALMWQADWCLLLAVPTPPSTECGTYFLRSVECVNVQILSSVATACRQSRRPCFKHYENNSCVSLKPTAWAPWPTSFRLGQSILHFLKGNAIPTEQRSVCFCMAGWYLLVITP